MNDNHFKVRLVGLAAMVSISAAPMSVSAQNDIPNDSIAATDSIRLAREKELAKKWAYEKKVKKPTSKITSNGNEVDVKSIQKRPTSSVNQMLDGAATGVYVQTPSAEPGARQGLLMRGSSVPFVDNSTMMENQPAIFVNGVPLVDTRSFVYAINKNNLNAPGTLINPLSSVEANNIESIELITDPIELAKLGPVAANGAIWIITKDGYYGGNHVTVDAGVTVNTRSKSVKMRGASDALAFRQSFGGFDSYKLPEWLSDTSDPNYYGPVNWADDYYSPSVSFNVDASLAGGSNIANYVFDLGVKTDDGTDDNVSFDRYRLGAHYNIMPFRGFSVNSFIKAAKMSRKRNTSMRDRYAEVEYMPAFVTPLVPTDNIIDTYHKYNEDYDDKNDNVSINGMLNLYYTYRGFHVSAGIKFDYMTDNRHVFYPSNLMESVNFVSDYAGYSRRVMGEGSVGYKFYLAEKNNISLDWYGTLTQDKYHYNYSRGYDSNDDKKPTTSGGGYKMYRYLDQEQVKLMSSAFIADYDYDNLVRLRLMFRQDGVSLVDNAHRWLITPGASLNLNLNKLLLKDNSEISALDIHGSWARVGRLLGTDRFALGPQYSTENVGWSDAPLIGSINGLSTLTRPYEFGWVGNGIKWPYTDKLEFGLKGSFWNSRLVVDVKGYFNHDKNLVVPVSVAGELGYKYKYSQGLEISNKGLEASLHGIIIKGHDNLTVTAGANIAYNINNVDKLPDGLSSVELGDRRIEIGSPSGMFWLLENKGIYTDESQIPVKDGKKLSVNGKPFRVGDPIWVDRNGDNVIDSNDKTLVGNMMPKVFGGFNAHITWKRFDLGMNFSFALGHKAMNYRAYQEYDFVNLDNNNNLASVKEFFFWQDGAVPGDYPKYNLGSQVNPYRFDQDLYLEDLSYLKMKSVTLGYNFKKFHNSSIYLYFTADNLFTVSKFKDDPDLVDFDGVYRGYGLSTPRRFTVGVKCSF